MADGPMVHGPFDARRKDYAVWQTIKLGDRTSQEDENGYQLSAMWGEEKRDEAMLVEWI